MDEDRSYLNRDRVDQGATAEFHHLHQKLQAALLMPVFKRVVTGAMLIPLFRQYVVLECARGPGFVNTSEAESQGG